MLARLRVVVAVTMLVGIFVLATMVLVGLVGAAVWAVRTGNGGIGIFVGSLVAPVGFVLVMGLVTVVRAVPHVPVGLSVSVMAEPELWAMVKEAAAAVGTRSPDEVRLVPEANAGVSEDARLLGLLPGTRVLYVGVPLLQTMTRSEVLWVLCHEMGHYSERHIALSGATRRGLVALSEIAAGLEGRRPFGWMFRGYLVVYARAVHALWRAEELDADRWAATACGPEVGVSALRATAAVASSWDTFDRDYASVGVRVGMVPQGVFAGYAVFLSEPARAAVDLDRLIADEPRSIHDTHPSTSKRIERLRAMPRTGTVVEQDEPALTVLTDAGRTLQDLEAHVARELSLTPTAWDRAVQLGNRRRDEERAIRVMGVVDRIAGGNGDLSQAFHLATHDERHRFAQHLAGHVLDEAVAGEVLREALAILVRCALVGAGHASYVLRWDRSDVIVDEAGVEVDVTELVAGVPGDPRSAEWLLEVLREEGISRTWNPGVSSRVLGPAGPEVRAVLVTQQGWGWAHPVLYVTEAGLAIRSLGYREYLSIPPLSPQKSPVQVLAHSVRFDGLMLLREGATEIVPWADVEHLTYFDGARPRVTVRRRGARQRSYRVVAMAGDAMAELTAFTYGRMSLG